MESAGHEAWAYDTSGDVDHRQAANPYMSKYGERWVDEISKSKTLRNTVSIRTLVEHIFSNSPGLVFHDALKQMTSKATTDWMKTKGFYKRWVLPENGVNRHISMYEGRPVGNSPELMQLD